MAEEAHNGAAAGIFALLLSLHLFLKFYARLVRSGKLRPQEVELLKEIKDLYRSANELSSPATFVKSAKLKRTAAAREKELAQLRQKLARKKGWWLPPATVFPKVLKVAVYLLLAQWFWHTSVASVPVALLKPSEYLLYTGKRDASGDRVEVGIIPWLLLSSRVSSYVAEKIGGTDPPKSNFRSRLEAILKFI